MRHRRLFAIKFGLGHCLSSTRKKKIRGDGWFYRTCLESRSDSSLELRRTRRVRILVSYANHLCICRDQSCLPAPVLRTPRTRECVRGHLTRAHERHVGSLPCQPRPGKRVRLASESHHSFGSHRTKTIHININIRLVPALAPSASPFVPDAKILGRRQESAYHRAPPFFP